MLSKLALPGHSHCEVTDEKPRILATLVKPLSDWFSAKELQSLIFLFEFHKLHQKRYS